MQTYSIHRKLKRTFAAACCVLVLSLASLSGAVERKILVETELPKESSAILLGFAENRFDIAYMDYGAGSCQLILTPGQLDVFAGLGLTYRVIHDDINAELRGNYFNPDGRDIAAAYHTYDELTQSLQDLAAAYPSICRLDTLGMSLENRVIWGLKISDNVQAEEEGEAEILYLGNHHARELISVEIPYYFALYLAENYGSVDRVTAIVNASQLWFVPMVNPDGHVYVETVDLSWRKNRRSNGDGSYGVDLNRNYDFQWAYDNVGSSPNGSDYNYRGTAPFSEPETDAVRRLVEDHEFVTCFTYHAYGEYYIYPWGYIDQHCSDHDLFSNIALNNSFSNNYRFGNSWETLRYYMNGEAVDWLYGADSSHTPILAFTVEVGNGSDRFYPDPARIPVLVNQHLEPNLWLAEIAADPQVVIPQSPQPELYTALVTDSAEYQIKWNVPDTSQVAGYRLYSMEGGTWSPILDETTLARSDTSVTVPAAFNAPLLLRSVDTTALAGVSYPSDVFGISAAGDFPPLLIVNGFNRSSGSWPRPFHNFVNSIADPLRYYDWQFQTCTNQAVIDGAVNLADYFAVFWILGDESTVDITLDSAEQLCLRQYLEQGGYLFISGSEIGWDLDHYGSTQDKDFYNNYLKASYLADDSGILDVEGSAGEILHGMEFGYGNFNAGSPYTEDYPDVIQPVNGSAACLNYAGTSSVASVRYGGTFGSGTEPGRLVYMAFPFETIHTAVMQRNVIYQVLYYFMSPLGLAGGNGLQPGNFALRQNYPNPFNPVTSIEYVLPRKSHVHLAVYDLLGREVAALVSETQEAGFKTVQWNASSVPSGVYFYRITAGDYTQARKMILLK